MAKAPEHAVLMDHVYRHQRYIYDLTRKYYLFGRDRMIRDLAPKPGTRIVEIGCGTARNLIQIAKRYPGTKLFGLDASTEMLKTAQAAVDRAGLNDRIVLAHGYAEALTPALFGETAAFDHAVFSYSLSMIPDWKQALRSAQAALAVGGSLHIVDFGDLRGLSGPARTLLLWWLGLFHVAPREELLGVLERAILDAGQGAEQNSLRLLAGRYAFILSSTRGNFPGL
jgi:S-adenosylmethionine-diacylgycerolhomoserine-N-methlytransferase